MKAMTMLFRVEVAALTEVAKGDSIAARMTHEDGVWWLRHIEKVAPRSSSSLQASERGNRG